jgi:hypothetical protein
LIRGDFRRAEQRRGRFRDYLKTVLINLVNDFHRCRHNRLVSLPDQLSDSAAGNSSVDDTSDEFLSSWRAELLERAWSALQDANSTWFAALRAHVREPGATAAEKAEGLAEELGESFTANRFRVTLHRARESFSNLLRKEVAASLDSPTDDELCDELRQLRLHRYVGRGK